MLRKGTIQRHLVADVGVDSNMQFYLVAYGIVETENNETWKWFIEQCKKAIGEDYRGTPWANMNNRHYVCYFVLNSDLKTNE